MLGGGSTLQSLIGELIGLINVIIPVLISIGLVIFFWGLVQYIYAAGDSSAHRRGRELIIWGLIALFVMVSIWGITGLLCESFFGNASCRVK